jgi:hypothetical protein
LKIATATDRNGNVTHYTYGTGTVTFDTANGSITENPLTQVSMPNGHTLDFTWTGNRISSVTDGVRTVHYAYTSGLLTSVTSPAGYVTTYGYSDAYTVTAMTPDMVAHNLLTSITDCRGLTTSIQYTMNPQPINHLMAGYGPCRWLAFSGFAGAHPTHPLFLSGGSSRALGSVAGFAFALR